MLRMGRGFNKTEAPEKDKPAESAHQPAPAHEQQQPYAAPAAQTTTPSRTEAPAHVTAQPSAAPVAAATNTSRAVTESEALARDIKEGVMNGFVGATTVLSGDAEFKGMLRVDGHFTGRIGSEKGTLIVSAGGVVEANIAVAVAKINGTVNGDIVATDRIEFGRTAQVRGNITTPSLVIEHGAIFEGSCRMRQDKPAAATNAAAAEQRPRNADTQPLRGKTPDKPERVPFVDKPRPAVSAEAVK